MNEIYTFTVPIFTKSLGGLKNILVKAKEAVTSGTLEEQKLLADQLWPDMFAFTKQVQVACDNAKGATARLAGVPVPAYEDTEQSLDELIARVDKTLAFIESIPEASFAGAAERQVVLPYFKDKYLSGFDYARTYAIPNFFFHLVTAYGLVRKNGVAVGKADYSNGLPFKALEA